MSQPMARLSKRAASISVVPEPNIGSRTTSPGTASRSMKNAGSCGGNFAGNGCHPWVECRLSAP